ncbi:MAG: glycosyltransferase [Anaerolineaceae bacterium]|nr:glycosyltransferase [Anaerolineaceae bacterium]
MSVGDAIPRLSVIIATKNRAEELRTISLPSLEKQDTRDFEVIVWDASEDESSKRVVGMFADLHHDLFVRYFRAPRSGSCAQRNDAVMEAKSEIVFFIDDDCEVSPDGIATLIELFAHNKSLAGSCLPFVDERTISEGQSVIGAGRIGAWLSAVYSRVFYPSSRLSGIGIERLPTQPGVTDFLSAGDMALRKDIFRDHAFDERLQRYAGYALWEDQQFSRRLRLEGHTLLVADKGFVKHRPSPVKRLGNPFIRGKVEGYNAAVIWRTTIFPVSHWSLTPFLWARIGFLGIVLLPCFLRPWQVSRWKRTAGYLAGLCSFLREEMQACALGSIRRALP